MAFTDPVKRACQLANQIAGSILLCGAQAPTHVSSTIMMDLRDAQWTAPMLRELRASMVGWALDDRSGIFSNFGYGDVGFLVADPVSRKRTFTVIGNVRKILGPQQWKILDVDEPFRKRRSIDHSFEGEFDDVIASEISPSITRCVCTTSLNDIVSTSLVNILTVETSPPGSLLSDRPLSHTSKNSRCTRNHEMHTPRTLLAGKVSPLAFRHSHGSTASRSRI
jgi:hypothetical protein